MVIERIKRKRKKAQMRWRSLVRKKPCMTPNLCTIPLTLVLQIRPRLAIRSLSQDLKRHAVFVFMHKVLILAMVTRKIPSEVPDNTNFSKRSFIDCEGYLRDQYGREARADQKPRQQTEVIKHLICSGRGDVNQLLRYHVGKQLMYHVSYHVSCIMYQIN